MLDYDATMEKLNGMRITLDGVAGEIKTWRAASFAGGHVFWHIGHEPSAYGRKSAAYLKIKRELGDDWSTEFTGETPAEVWAQAQHEGRVVERAA